jgi:hypothetical protein
MLFGIGDRRQALHRDGSECSASNDQSQRDSGGQRSFPMEGDRSLAPITPSSRSPPVAAAL